MIVERALTAYLKRKFNNILDFSQYKRITPPNPRDGSPYLLYVHIPFCEELCPYCSFNRFPLDVSLAQDYFRALAQEVRVYSNLGFDFRSVYVGGGTPTVLPREMADLLNQLHKLFSIRQVSLETNPNHLTTETLSMLKDAGVNRLSIGVQSFDDSLLKKMERYHKYGSGSEIRDRLATLMGFFDTLNVDMIFNFPSQTVNMLEEDLDIIKQIKADQVTFYPLMVSDITRKELALRFGPICYRREKLFYEMIVQRLEKDYQFGTAWCFSRQCSMIDEYIVDHDEYVGVGSGSFGYVGGACYANTFDLKEYIDKTKSGQLPLLAKREFLAREQIQYDFMMHLFGASLDLGKAKNKHGGRFAKALWKEILFLRLIGALTGDNGVLRLTNRGRYLWVVMMREFFTGVNNFRDSCRLQAKNSQLPRTPIDSDE